MFDTRLYLRALCAVVFCEAGPSFTAAEPHHPQLPTAHEADRRRNSAGFVLHTGAHDSPLGGTCGT